MMTGKEKIYRAVDVWKRNGDGRLLRYRCFHVLPDNTFVVQSCDAYRASIDPEQVNNLERQFVELLSEDAPDERSIAWPSIEEAVRDHDRQFGNE
jgi:hypothetical protein